MKNASDFSSLYYYVNSAVFYLAMLDYPYPVNFLEPLPGFPVKYACTYAKSAPSDNVALAKQLYEVINVYYNYSGTLDYHCFTRDCPDTTAGSLDVGLGWAWQVGFP
ncbi:unnamed protein product [Gongylonema pulchrum]|uniref:Uncharacterized protein n=1 Tax=Gongylonema pulchrum TaxID=637853 RepID=A0A183DLW7_9BILA|nr:unnamed protein product [Gongylonema pulchrum]